MPMFKRSMVILALILAVAGGISIYSCYEQEEAVELAEGAAGSEIAKEQVAVYVTGAVEKPGVVYVDFDGRVAEAVNKCGGLLPDADMARVNMAETVKDGMQIRVPEKIVQAAATNAVNNNTSTGASASKSTGTKAASASSGSSGGDMVNINTAGVDELKKLKGIGPAMAQRIIDYREANGAFQRAEDLQKVKGIGKAKFAKLQQQVVL